MKTILLVEDEALIALAEAQMLEKHGFRVIPVHNALRAIETAAREHIDLILMDIDLGHGKMDGTEAAEIILKDQDLPIVFLSSHTEPEVVEKTEGITSYGYIVKNSGEMVLIASIRMAFRLHDAYMELKNRKENLRTALVREEQAREELLMKSEELDRYFSSSLDMICIASTKGEFVRLNPEWEKVLGYSLSELEGRPFIDLVHEEDREKTLYALSRLTNQEEVLSFENRYRCRDGSYRWIEWRSKPVGTAIYATARDITHRKEAEQNFKALFDHMLDGAALHEIITDEQSNPVDYRFLAVNPAFEKMTGLKGSDIIGKTVLEVLPGTEEYWIQIYGKVALTGDPAFFENSAGTLEKIFEVKAFQPAYGQFVSIFFDITDRKLAERNLKMSEENLRITLNSIGDAVISTDVRGKVVRMNPVAENLCGWSTEQARGRDLHEVLHILNADTREEVDTPATEVLRTGRIVGLANHTLLISRGGEEYQIADSAAPIMDNDGNITGVVLVFRNITDKYEKEKQLQASEKKYRELFENAPVGIFMTDSRGRALQVNPTMAAMVGAASPEDAIANFTELSSQLYVHGEKREEFLQRLKRDGEVENFEYEARKKDGEHRWFSMNARMREGSEKDEFLIEGYTTDITERKNTGKKIRESERVYKTLFENMMKELNHRVKNNLMMISLLIKLKGDASDRQVDFSDIIRQIDAIRIIHENLDLSEDGTTINLREYLKNLLSTVFSFHRNPVHLEMNIKPEYFPASTAVPLGLIINEIATNAVKHGFEDNGEARFSLDFTGPGKEGLFTLELSNNGRVVPEEIVLEKPETLGLSLVCALTEQLGGTIALKRRPNTEFTVTFPAEKR